MLISVIIPTCHRNDLLAKCLDQIAPGKQKLAKECYEVIISDDGSRSTAQMLIKEKYPWARWVAGPRQGPAANRNLGASTAGAEWLVFLDDDCVPEYCWLSAYQRAIATDEALVYEGRTYTESESKGLFWVAPTNETGGYLWSCNFAIKRETFYSIGQFDPLFPYPHLEDVDFRERLRSAGHTFTFCREAAVFHPLRPVSPIVRQALGHESFFYFAKKHGRTLSQAGLSLRAFVKARKLWLESAKNPKEIFRFLIRSGVETTIVAALLPWWLLKFHSVKPCPKARGYRNS